MLFAAPRTAGAADTHAYTNADVGFEESIYQTVDPGPRLDREKAYAGSRTSMVRVDLDWFWLEHERCDAPCALDWSGIDKTVDAAYARGFKVLLILDYAPAWADGGKNSGGFFPTRDHDADWVTIVNEAVAHFGDKVQAYEIWNEPNQQEFGDFAVSGTDAQRVPERKKRYWELVRLAYPRIKAGCPDCVVLAGGSANGTPSGPDSTSASWLQAGYDQGARGFFDAVAHHPYYPNYDGPAGIYCGTPWYQPFGLIYKVDAQGQPCGSLGAVRKVMVANGDSAKKVWGTEWGEPTVDTDRPVDSLSHVRNLQVDAVHRWRSVDWTGPLFLFTFQDSARTGACAPDNSLGNCHFGVETADAQPKTPLFEDLRDALRGEWPDRLWWNQSLFEGSALRSPDGRFYVWMQGDGNLVLYRAADNKVLWKVTNLAGSRLINQADGSLALMNRQNTSVWSSGPRQGADRTTTLVMQNDGNLVLYRDSDHVPVWATNTCCQ